MKVVAILALCLAVASAGVVNHTRCGGVGTFHEMRIDGCSGAVCQMKPGTPYLCEGDFSPSGAAPSLSLKVSVVFLGTPITIVDTELPNSNVLPGQRTTIRFSITPNDLLLGNTIPVNAEVRHTASGLVEVCVTVQARIAN